MSDTEIYLQPTGGCGQKSSNQCCMQLVYALARFAGQFRFWIRRFRNCKKRFRRILLRPCSLNSGRALRGKLPLLRQWCRRTFVPQGAHISRSASAYLCFAEMKDPVKPRKQGAATVLERPWLPMGGRKKKTCPTKRQESTWLRPAFSWKALSLIDPPSTRTGVLIAIAM